MILHKWTIILVGFLVALLEEKTRKTTEFPVPQVSPSSFSQWKEVQKCDTDYTQDAKNPQLHHLKKIHWKAFFCGSKSQIFKKSQHDDWWFWSRFGYFNFFVFEATMNFRFLGSHTELDLGTHHRGVLGWGCGGLMLCKQLNTSQVESYGTVTQQFMTLGFFPTLPGEMIQIWLILFQRGWNHQQFMILKSNNSSFWGPEPLELGPNQHLPPRPSPDNGDLLENQELVFSCLSGSVVGLILGIFWERGLEVKIHRLLSG